MQEGEQQTATTVEQGEESLLVTENVRQALAGIRNGQVTITVRNGQITQIDRILRLRQFKSKPAQWSH